MCYGMGCKYERSYDGECTLSFTILGTDDMPKDAECRRDYKEEEECKENTEK